jgi:tRNA pseudouridine32 synthase/23S rRNA pseudouridine746 synthase
VPPALEILYESRSWLAINKPSGLLSVPGKGDHNQDCVAARVRALFAHASGPITVHRLDMDTSGILLVGLTSDAQRCLSIQFERREVSKRYIAVVNGYIEAESGLIDLPIRPDLSNRPYQIVDDVNGRSSQTRWRLLDWDRSTTRLSLEPLTGRAHQLRVHAAHPRGLNAPILGDVLYGDGAASAPRLMLHAECLTFTDPDRGQLATISAPVPF